MPDYLRRPIWALTLAFDAWSLLWTGRPFHTLGPERRWRQIESWRTARLSFRRDLMRFYEGLIVFGWNAERYES
jgi:hypothetical protein